MTPPLTREKVLKEIDALAEQVDRLRLQLDSVSGRTPPEAENWIDEVERAVPLARMLVSSGDMDFRRAEIGIAGLRQLVSDAKKLLSASELAAAKND